MTKDFFPASPRVIYDKTPLREVICQFRFPPVLRVEAQTPADFQDRVRDRFPLLERSQPVNANILAQLPSDLLNSLGAPINNTSYIFRADDGAHLTLTPDSLALTVTAYTCWEDFRATLAPAIDALIEIYRPAYFTRTGLRYLNVILREALGLNGRSWGDILIPEIVGELALPQWESGVEDARRVIRSKIANTPDAVLLQHGIAQVEGVPETGYMLDFDFYSDNRTEVGDAHATVDRLNGYTGRAFRWCIKPAVHAAMGPREL
ncbi:TIGR04255 family protein [Sphingobium sp. SA2]|uniref:TIGR04255 family protein n=1 Tax=Sphingobium sp. SA2 TaxID=1524832 RepID=UPI0028C1C3DD|nr:TIGR04255 family protein [Sphingobium sp. SA2]MDT7533364.1 TIGR04255 family protein [Sphingobium sp. SA2]